MGRVKVGHYISIYQSRGMTPQKGGRVRVWKKREGLGCGKKGKWLWCGGKGGRVKVGHYISIYQSKSMTPSKRGKG